MHRFPSISATIIFMGASVNSNMAKSSADQRKCKYGTEHLHKNAFCRPTGKTNEGYLLQPSGGLSSKTPQRHSHA